MAPQPRRGRAFRLPLLITGALVAGLLTAGTLPAAAVDRADSTQDVHTYCPADSSTVKEMRAGITTTSIALGKGSQDPRTKGSVRSCTYALSAEGDAVKATIAWSRSSGKPKVSGATRHPSGASWATTTADGRTVAWSQQGYHFRLVAAPGSSSTSAATVQSTALKLATAIHYLRFTKNFWTQHA